MCILLEVLRYQKVVNSPQNLSTEFSTTKVEMFAKS
jgi:hypothetical protein